MNRRECLALLAATAFNTAAGQESGAQFSDADYAHAIVIDGQGGFDDPNGDPNESHLSARAVSELRQSGETACSFTVNEVGNSPDVWAKTIKNVSDLDQMISDNPDVLMKALRTADIRSAKVGKKTAIICNTQDPCFPGIGKRRYSRG
jgi:membrane dipeptidase